TVIPEGEAQKVQALVRAPHVYHPRFLAVELQPQPAFQFAFDEALQTRTDVPRQHHKIVSIAYQFGVGPLCRAIRPMKHPVEPVKIDVRQQWTEHSALRRAPLVAPESRWRPFFLGM